MVDEPAVAAEGGEEKKKGKTLVDLTVEQRVRLVEFLLQKNGGMIDDRVVSLAARQNISITFSEFRMLFDEYLK